MYSLKFHVRLLDKTTQIKLFITTKRNTKVEKKIIVICQVYRNPWCVLIYLRVCRLQLGMYDAIECSSLITCIAFYFVEFYPVNLEAVLIEEDGKRIMYQRCGMNISKKKKMSSWMLIKYSVCISRKETKKIRSHCLYFYMGVAIRV